MQTLAPSLYPHAHTLIASPSTKRTHFETYFRIKRIQIHFSFLFLTKSSRVIRLGRKYTYHIPLCSVSHSSFAHNYPSVPTLLFTIWYVRTSVEIRCFFIPFFPCIQPRKIYQWSNSGDLYIWYAWCGVCVRSIDHSSNAREAEWQVWMCSFSGSGDSLSGGLQEKGKVSGWGEMIWRGGGNLRLSFLCGRIATVRSHRQCEALFACAPGWRVFSPEHLPCCVLWKVFGRLQLVPSSRRSSRR